MEPMEDDDSFNQPVPRSIPLKPKIPIAQNIPKTEDSDPDSDDSFETFAATQTTNGGSIKSSASSTQSNEIKAPPPIRQQAPPTSQSKFSGGTQNIAPPSSATKRPPPQVQRSQCSHAPPTHPPISSNFQKSGPPQSSRPVILHSQQINNSTQIGIHSAVTNTKMMTGPQKLSGNATVAAPASPNSLTRHQSANSGLRNMPHQTPSSFRTGNIFQPRTTPPFDSQRPATPSGDVIMLRDQLENEKRKVLKLQAEFQKDNQKKEEEHQKHLAAKDMVIERQKKDLEMLKSTMACQKKTTSESKSSATSSMKNPIPTSSSTPSLPSSSSDVKKVYPKIPSAPESSKIKTPRRPHVIGHHLSAFRHPFKDEEDDTFQLNSSFEPSATSTPKMSGLIRTGLRRPLDLGAGDDGDENIRGAPTPKRKPVFSDERKKRTRREVQEEIRKIWDRIPEDSGISEVSDKPKFAPKIPKNSAKNAEKMDTETDEYIDRKLAKRLKILDFRRKNPPLIPEKSMTSRVKNRILKETEAQKTLERKCAKCHVADRDSLKNREFGDQKEWEKQEIQRRELMKKEAEELRSLHYTSMIHAVNRKGIDEFKGATRRNEAAELQYQKMIQGIQMRNLDEIREEKRADWRRQLMEKLEEDGEMYANLEIREFGKNDDYIWTEDEWENDLDFPEPYHHLSSSLCSDCRFHQKRQRRLAKKEWEKRRISTECLMKFGKEKREELRNQSILTKSRIEAADRSLFQANEMSSNGSDGPFGVFQNIEGVGDVEHDDDDDGFF
ncbi:hypothetical protein B9Z55_015286 [Caenorhabditis nigoni]|uniref:Uncharacterized protein n=2 Tax=Caenorhabditis nigoni TaxID=1611254 RepID=A0A2G5U9K2_9PELO|nr:hypothetical protein B9Z55_015286 [Caenorhabditis nigoni]